MLQLSPVHIKRVVIPGQIQPSALSLTVASDGYTVKTRRGQGHTDTSLEMLSHYFVVQGLPQPGEEKQYFG